MNTVVLEGTLGNVKALSTGKGTPGARFTVRVPHERGDGADTIPAVAWDTTARAILDLGDDAPVSLSGRLSRRAWEKDGAKVWETSVTITAVSRSSSADTGF